MIGSAVVGAAGSAYASKKSSKAAQTQAQAADNASQMQWDMYDQTRKDLDPYNQAGKNALGQLTSAANSNDRYRGGQFNYNGSSNPNYTSPQYQANAFNFETDPSYEFRKQQGMDGIQSQAAAAGGLLSGATLKALNAYNSDLASQEYGNAFNRYQTDEQRRYNQYLGQEQLNQGQHQQAFNNWQSQDNNAYARYTTDQNNRFNRLSTLASMGQNAAAQVGNNGMQTAQSVANNTMAGANALAAGQVANANNWANTANNMGSMAMTYAMMKNNGSI